MQEPKLFMLMLGCRPAGRNTEQHDIFFGIGYSVKDLIPDIKAFWPDAKENVHVDAWRAVTQVGDYIISVVPREGTLEDSMNRLFFLNLGGYKAGEFDEFHYKMLAVATDKSAAIRQARQTAFYKHTGFKGAASHIDDKYGVDVDELHQVKDILPEHHKQKYQLLIQTGEGTEDELHLGYFKLNKL